MVKEELTVGKLKSLIKNLTDSNSVRISSDTIDSKIIAEDAYVSKDKSLVIYANKEITDDELDEFGNYDNYE